MNAASEPAGTLTPARAVGVRKWEDVVKVFCF